MFHSIRYAGSWKNSFPSSRIDRAVWPNICDESFGCFGGPRRSCKICWNKSHCKDGEPSREWNSHHAPEISLRQCRSPFRTICSVYYTKFAPRVCTWDEPLKQGKGFQWNTNLQIQEIISLNSRPTHNCAVRGLCMREEMMACVLPTDNLARARFLPRLRGQAAGAERTGTLTWRDRKSQDSFIMESEYFTLK